ncbi:hypothetical protein PYS58_21550 [Chryseobacterium indologenes]|uniref:hypothetical protein n=1 Tax=Chryseobacterium indologenes TaxID=253 RepID=UPI0023E7C6E6|nr:hypothetical protein [Chryseobacterium indologenes]WET49106.1 hypothetical protein PYS58_21550 [Chryseobacterium indologenes]
MIIGHYVIRTYRKFKNQGLGTRFVIVGIPLIPVQSFYIFKDTGRTMEVDLYWKQAVKVYLIMISVFYLFIKYLKGSSYNEMPFEKLFLIVLTINALVYFLFDPYTRKDRQIRELLSRSVYINALPKFLGQTAAYNVQSGFIRTFRENFGGANWKDMMKSGAYTDQHIPFLFPIILYDLYLYENEVTKRYFDTVFKRYKELENI